MSAQSVAGTRDPLVRGALLDRERLLLVICLVSLFVVAAGIRLYHMNSLFPGPLADREYRSALIARGLYLQATASPSDPRLRVAIANLEREPVLEPPVVEWMAYLGYRLAGREDLLIPRLMSATFWLAGGLLLFGIARRVTSPVAATFAVAYYLLLPEGLRVSTGFQPDSLMVMLFLGSIAAIVRYYEEPSTRRILLAAVLSALTLLIRPLPVFVLFSVYAALALWKYGSPRWLLSRRSLLFAGIALLPAVLFYLYYGFFVAGFMDWKSETSFRPNLFLYYQFWRDWLLIAAGTLGLPALLGALLGIPFLARGLPRSLVVSALAGFILFGLVFNYHIHTHTYYHAQAIPFVAISLGALAVVVLGPLRQACDRWYWWAPVAAAVLVVAAMGVLNVRATAALFRGERPEVAHEIGELVNHSTEVAIVGPYYGATLKYYAEISGAPWLRSSTNSPMYRLPGERERSIQERLDGLGFSPEFFVITDLREYEGHHADMRKLLEANWLLVARTGQYIIYKAPGA